MAPIDTPASTTSPVRRSEGPRHVWLVGDVPDCLDLTRRLDGAGTTTVWAAGTWRPERLLNILGIHMTLTQIFEAPELADLRAAERVISVDPALCRNTTTRMVIVTPHLPSLPAARLAEIGIAVFKVGRIAQDDPAGAHAPSFERVC